MEVKGIRTIWTAVLSLLILCACLGVRNVGGSPAVAVMLVEPYFNSADVGSIFTVDIIVENVEECYSWQVHMNWSTTVLNLSSHYYDYMGKTVTVAHVTFGDFMADAPDGTNQVKYVNYDVGWIEFGETMIGTYPDGIDGNGWLGTVEFKVVGAGETVLDIEYGTTVTPYALTYMINYFDEDIEMVAENGYFLDVPSPWATDINEDGRIDIRDIARVCRMWGWEGTPGSIPEDINDDGYVDIVDLTAVAGEYGTQYYP